MRRLAAPLAVALVLAGPACKSKQDDATGTSAGAIERETVPAGTEGDIQALDGASYSRSLAQQLDLVPPDADGYLVIRDLRPLIEQSRRVALVMAGPLSEAIPALAKLGGGTGEARLEQLERVRELLELLLAGLEASGIELDQGAVVALGDGPPTVVFAAADLERLGMLAALAGDEIDLSRSCGELSENPSGEGSEHRWFACSLGGAEVISSYAPAGQGQALAARLGDRLGGLELDPINVALSLVEERRPIDAALRTDPGLWELSMPLPPPDNRGEDLIVSGAAPALRALVPGTSFVWARVNHGALGEGPSLPAPISPELLTGELWFGVVDEPSGLIAQAGITDASAVAKAIMAVAKWLPGEAIEPEQFEGLSVEFDRASIDLDGKLVPSIGLRASGPAVEAWTTTLGVDARARVWAYGDYLSFALGEVQAIPAALTKLEGSGPSPAAIATLAPTLARALLGGEVGLAMHLVLDHWQAPPSEAELEALVSGVPPDSRPSPAAITAAFEALAPWSSVDVWLSRKSSAQQQWLLHVSLVPFGVGGDAAETEAAAQVLDAVLTGGDAEAGYRDLLARFPDSALASSYRARVGDAPAHHAAVGMVELGALATLVVPVLSGYLDRAKSSEAPAQTQSILSAALAVRERDGCEPLIGEAKPTPPLSVACHAGEGGRCHPIADGEDDGPGRYPASAWTSDPIWTVLGYRPNSAGHRFHYGFVGETLDGGGCRLRVRAWGDVDGDGRFSTYEREATIAADGSQTLAPMRIEEPEP